MISSHVARGAVGLRGGAFACERLGLTVWSVPTVSLPYHPGHGRATRLVPDSEAFADFLRDIAASPWSAEIDTVVSGYLGNAEQAQAVAETVSILKSANPHVRYVCDPVIGDVSGLYVPEATACAMRDTLLPMADYATPNRFELAWLTNSIADTHSEIERLCADLGPKTTAVTSAPALMRDSVAVQLVAPDETDLIEHLALDTVPNGTGDLFTALFAARLTTGNSATEATRLATSSVFEIVARTAKAGGDELGVAAEQAALIRPAAHVHVRKLTASSALSLRKALKRQRPADGVTGGPASVETLGNDDT